MHVASKKKQQSKKNYDNLITKNGHLVTKTFKKPQNESLVRKMQKPENDRNNVAIHKKISQSLKKAKIVTQEIKTI